MLLRGRNFSRVARLSLGLAASGAAAVCLGGSALAAAPTSTNPLSAGSATDTQVTTTDTTTATTEVTTTQTHQVTTQTSFGGATTTSGTGAGSGQSGETTKHKTVGTGQVNKEAAPQPETSDTSTLLAVQEASLGSESAAGSEASKTQQSLPSAAPVARTAQPNWRTGAAKPIIVGASAGPDDLASALPSAPNPVPTRTPAKSTGLLGNLTLVLAGTVVPDFLTLAPAVRPAALVPLALLVVLLLTAPVGLTYGRWLRRAGYATAARSDLAAFFSLPAPIGVSYVRELRFSYPVAHFLWCREPLKLTGETK